ncbi:TcpQ domain-containing protein [Ralstonia insidiosa]|jgi:hypothetical protein|nr:hypothetical protein [Ralstonia insidiosa]MBA9939912.1 hypothetical protein [Ralstonia insidiosa]MBC9968573.1 TcpQ domain-containing protein [Ralstonia insidiosa]MBX3904606.1 toxin co-regulated pilus biosynthesis Q family protein [Ralstonia insidiosa]
MDKLIALALLVVASAANAADTGRYVASKEDKTVAGMVTRWGAQDGRVVRWDAGYDVEIRSAEGITSEAHLQSASSLIDAVQRIVKLLATKPVADDLSRKLNPLAPCVYSEGEVYMIVRPLSESCGS